MRLIYTATRQPVAIGDRHTVDGFDLVVAHAPRPHKPDSEGKINFNMADGTSGPVFYCGVIGARWIEREDRGESRESSPAKGSSPMSSTRLILIDRDSGFIMADALDAELGEGAASLEPIALVLAFERCIGNDIDTLRFGEHGRGAINSGQSGYIVKRVPASVPQVEDGQDRSAIEQVEEEGEFVSFITRESRPMFSLNEP